MQAHKLLAGARLHQATHALIGLCSGGYKDTVQAHKLLAGARLHQAIHALIGFCVRWIQGHSAGTEAFGGGQAPSGNTCSHWSLRWGIYRDTVLAHKLLAGANGLHQATHALKEYSDTELTHDPSINQCGRWGFKDTVLEHKLWQGQPSSVSARSHWLP